MLLVFELNVKKLAFAEQKNSSNAKGFFEELGCNPVPMLDICGHYISDYQGNMSNRETDIRRALSVRES